MFSKRKKIPKKRDIEHHIYCYLKNQGFEICKPKISCFLWKIMIYEARWQYYSYLFEVRPALTRKALIKAKRKLSRFQSTHPGSYRLIVGYTPKKDKEIIQAEAVTAKLRSEEFWIWNLDYRFDTFNYYPPLIVEDSKSGCSSWLWCLAAIVVVVAIVALASSSMPLARYSHNEYGETIKGNLYYEVKEWDIRGAQNSINGLILSSDICDQRFGYAMSYTLEENNYDPSSLQDFNQLIRDIEKESDCVW